MKQRFALLLQAKVISQKAYDNGLQTLALLDNELGLPHENEQYQMALTHLTRAADRIWIGEVVLEKLDSDILDEIYADPDAETIIALHKKALNTMKLTQVPASEESFMIANIYSLYQASKTPNTKVQQ